MDQNLKKMNFLSKRFLKIDDSFTQNGAQTFTAPQIV